MSSRQRLFERITEGIAPGKVEWIGLRRERRGVVDAVDSAKAIADLGIEGDHRCHGTPGSARQVSLISAEHIQAISQILRKAFIDPALLRRNIVVSGININALRYQKFLIGDALFEATALCHPCSRMEKNLGKGGHAAMLGHGGLCAKVVRSGCLYVGSDVSKLS